MFKLCSLGGCPYDLPAFILVVLILSAIIIHNRRFKKKRDAYQQEIQDKKEP